MTGFSLRVFSCAYFPSGKASMSSFFSFFQGSARISSVSLDLCWCLTVQREERESKGNSCVFSIILLGAAVTEVILVWVLASGPIFIPVLQCRLRCLSCCQGYLLLYIYVVCVFTILFSLEAKFRFDPTLLSKYIEVRKALWGYESRRNGLQILFAYQFFYSVLCLGGISLFPPF